MTAAAAKHKPGGRQRLLMAGAFLSGAGKSRAPIEDLADRLETGGFFRPIRVSPLVNGWLRGLHLVAAVLFGRPFYQLAVVDLFSGRAFWWGDAVTRLLQLLGCPFVLVLHGGGLPEFAAQYPERVAACLRRARFVSAPSRFLQETMQPYRSDILLIPNPLDIGQYPYRRRAAGCAPRLVWLRAFHRIYNPLLAVRVAARLAEEFPGLTLTMIGGDKDGSLAEARREAERLGIAARVEFTGNVAKKDVPARLAAHDLFLNTTNYDNTPVSVMEAMACGLCVVSTNVGGLTYLVEDGADALLVPPADEEAMTAAVRRILKDPDLAGRLSGAGRAKVEEFDWSRVLPEWLKLLGATTAAASPATAARTASTTTAASRRS